MIVLKNVKLWLDRLIEKWRHNNADVRHRNLKREVYNSLQIMEFEGKVYISYHDIPIVCSDELKTSVIDVLENSRKSLLNWKIQNK